MAIGTANLPTVAREVENETTSTIFVTLNSDAKVVSADPDNPAAETGASFILVTLQGDITSSRKCTLLNLREKWAGAKTIGAVVTVFGRFFGGSWNYVWRELPMSDGVFALDFGTATAIVSATHSYSPMKVVDCLGADAILVLISTASNAATSSIIEGHLVGPS